MPLAPLLAFTIAAAANTRPALEALRPALERAAGEKVEVVYGSTGTLEKQIENGAPFDLFLSADEVTPARLAHDGYVDGKTVKTYAVGVLVLAVAKDAGFPAPARLDATSASAFRALPFRRLAVPSPKLAPYGRAAMEALTKLGLADALEPRIVNAENVEQALVFVRSGNAELGFAAASEAERETRAGRVLVVLVDPALHEPIRQAAGIPWITKKRAAAERVLDAITGAEARTTWTRFGYRLP